MCCRHLVSRTLAPGLFLIWSTHALAGPEAPTFHRDIAPILVRHCAVCHHAGEVAPFSVLSYDDVKHHATQIAAAVKTGYMPPWLPEHGLNHFSNERHLAPEDIREIVSWVAAGSPEGSPPISPERSAFAEGWQLGKPDLVLRMPVAFSVPAKGQETYRCFVIPAESTSDRRLRAVEFRPNSRGVIHHAIVVADLQHAGRRLETTPGEGYDCGGGFGFAMPGMLTMWTAGTVAHADPPGVAAVLKKNSDLVVQLHLRPRKQAVPVQVEIGLYFSRDAAPRAPVDLSVTSYDVDIAPGEAAHKVTAFAYVPADADVYSIYAHAHYLAKRFHVTATQPNGEVRPLLSIQHWNFDWQESFWYAAPMRLPEGTRLDLEVVYDNSTNNPRNPNSPPKRVTWGFLSTDEMCEVHLRAVLVDPNGHAPMESMH